MKCFYNSKEDAVAICKVCGKGLSIKYLKDTDNGIVCMEGKCDSDMEKTQKMMNTLQNKSSQNLGIITNFIFGLAAIIFSIGFYGMAGNSFIFAFSFMLIGITFVIRSLYTYWFLNKK